MAPSLIYTICKAFLEKVGFAFHGAERTERLQVPYSKLQGIPGVAFLALHSHTFMQTSFHTCEDMQRNTPVRKHPDLCLLPPSSGTRNMSKSTYSKRGKNELALGAWTIKPYDSRYESMCKPRQALCAHLVFPFMHLWFLWHRKSTLEQPCLLSSERIKKWGLKACLSHCSRQEDKIQNSTILMMDQLQLLPTLCPRGGASNWDQEWKAKKKFSAQA